MRHDLGNIEAIAQDVDTKTFDEVSAYMAVFMQRFREVREADQVILKLQKKDFEERNLETIRDFDAEKANELVVLLQENHYFNRNSYLSMISRAHDKLVGEQSHRAKFGGLQFRLDHFIHA